MPAAPGVISSTPCAKMPEHGCSDNDALTEHMGQLPRATASQAADPTPCADLE